jgi:hypothetical protein
LRDGAAVKLRPKAAIVSKCHAQKICSGELGIFGVTVLPKDWNLPSAIFRKLQAKTAWIPGL